MIQLPENLDIHSLVSQQPPTFNYNIDCFNYIVNLILTLPAWNADLFERENIPFVPIHAITLQKVIWNYDDYLRYLIDTNVLESDNLYLAGVKSKGYRLTSIYRTKTKENILSNTKLNNRIFHLTQSQNELAQKTYPHLIQWFDDLAINTNSATDYLNVLYNQEIENGQTQSGANMRFAARYAMIQDIEEQNHKFTIDSCGHRFHSCLTNLKSQLRPHLSYRGQKLVSVDISNSQPFLAASLLTKHFFEPVTDDYRLCLFDLADNLIQLVSPLVADILPTFASEFTSSISSLSPSLSGAPLPMLVKLECDKGVTDDVLLYREQVQSGRFYECLQAGIKRITDQSCLTRNEVKEMCMTVFFSNSNHQHKYFALQRDSFNSLFPTVYNYFNLLKSRQHNTLAALLQGIEAKIVLDRICRRITDEKPDLPIFTLHDSVITTVGLRTILKL